VNLVSRKLADGTLWPVPGEELAELEWRMRYGTALLQEDRLAAASVINAYRYLLTATVRRRNTKAKMIREVMQSGNGEQPTKEDE
jgi:hypothetical protein